VNRREAEWGVCCASRSLWRSVRHIALLFAAAFAGVCVAVSLSGFTRVDQWSVDHVMPWLSPVTHPQTVASIMLPFNGRPHGAEIPLELWTYPASVPVSTLVLALCCALLWRRGRRAAATAWAAVWVVGNAVEVVGKSVIHRPALHMLWHGGHTHVVGFDDSFPSGHTLRALLVAVLVGLLWRRARPAAAAWAAVTLALLVATNAHTPSDVLGGALLAGALAITAAHLTRVSTSQATNASGLGGRVLWPRR
jgi:membrane-associated phospholipid phosphatase